MRGTARRGLLAVGHRSHLGVPVAFGVLEAGTWLGDSRWGGCLAAVGVSCLILLMAVQVWGHDRRWELCRACAVQVAVDGRDGALRRVRALRVYHSLWPLRAAVLLLVCGAGLLWVCAPVGRAGMNAGAEILAVVIVLMRVHARWRRWCPFCHEEG